MTHGSQPTTAACRPTRAVRLALERDLDGRADGEKELLEAARRYRPQLTLRELQRSIAYMRDRTGELSQVPGLIESVAMLSAAERARRERVRRDVQAPGRPLRPLEDDAERGP